ncbi:MAG: hypothetical protein IBX55_00780 [Methyloprofundus sp.]|nr:hypothetical protein [Methyloprofundus sp.]
MTESVFKTLLKGALLNEISIFFSSFPDPLDMDAQRKIISIEDLFEGYSIKKIEKMRPAGFDKPGDINILVSDRLSSIIEDKTVVKKLSKRIDEKLSKFILDRSASTRIEEDVVAKFLKEKAVLNNIDTYKLASMLIDIKCGGGFGFETLEDVRCGEGDYFSYSYDKLILSVRDGISSRHAIDYLDSSSKEIFPELLAVVEFYAKNSRDAIPDAVLTWLKELENDAAQQYRDELSIEVLKENQLES